jgi:lysophospholipase L1-like esterase
MWTTLARDFPEQRVINRGFGGSQIEDCTYYAERIVIPYKPRLVVLRAGGNDIAAGKTPEQVRADFEAFAAKVRARLPGVRIAYMTINATPARWSAVQREQQANRLIRDWIAQGQNLDYIDTFAATQGGDGRPRADLFLKDGLHFNAEGYKILASLVRPHLGSAAASARPGDVLGCEHFAFLRASISGGLGGPAREALRSWGSEKAGGMDRQGTYYHIDGNNSIVQRVRDGAVRLFAGDGTRGYRDGPADQAQFDFGCGSYSDEEVQCDAAGSVYVSEAQAGRLRKIARQPDGTWTVSTVAGGGQHLLKKGEAVPAREIKDGVASRFALTPDGTAYTAGYPGILRIQAGRATLLADAEELKKALGQRTALADWHVGGSHITPDGMFYWMPGGGPNLLRFDTRTGKAERFAGIGRTEQYLDGPTLLTSGFHTVLVVYSPDASVIYTSGGDESIPRRIRDGRVMSLYRDGVFRPFDRTQRPPGGREDRWNQMAGVQCLDPQGRLYLTTGDYGWGGWVVRMTFAGGNQP